jgi:CspA family cold shock protein
MSNSSVTGSVKFFNAAKGFGFIAPEDGGKDVFVPAASIAASGLSRLKAGQRVSFDLEPDAKGPKAVKLTVLEDAPAPPPSHAPSPPRHTEIRQHPATTPAKKPVTVYSDSATANGAAEAVLEALSAAGETPLLVEISAATRDELMQLSLLLREADQNLVRRYDPLFLALQLDDRFISESDFWTGIVEHPSLVNSPVVTMAGKARICKSAADVKAFLGTGSQATAIARPLQDKPKGISPRMAALIRGESLPPRPPSPPPPEAKLPAKAQAKPAAEPKPPAKAVEKAPAKAAAPKPAKPAAKPKPQAAPVKKAAAKVTQKVVKKAGPAPAKAKKKK